MRSEDAQVRGPLTGRTWQVFLGVGGVSILAYFLLGDPKSQMILYQATGIVSVGAMLVGVRRNRPAATRPWILLALGIAAWVVGDAIWNSYELVLHRVAPWPSRADYVYLVGPVLMAFGLTGMLRRRGTPRDVEGALDALIITAGALTLSWAFLMAPYLEDASLSGFAKLVAVGYPLGDLLLLAVIARLVLDTGSHSVSHRLLASAVMCTFVGDIVYSVQSLQGTYHTGHIVDTSWLAFYWLIAAAALHPSMAKITHDEEPETERLSRSRLGMLALAAALAPLTLVVQWLRDAPLDVPVIAGASLLIFLLVLARMARLVRAFQGKVSELKTQGAHLGRSLEDGEELRGRLHHQGLHDPLTDLATLNLLTDRLDHAITRLDRSGGAVGLLVLNIDDFKVINDSLGHGVGDLVLVELAQRMSGFLRGGDLAARIGGDEFAILLEEMTGSADAARAADRLLGDLDGPIAIAGGKLRVHGSIGVSSTENPLTNGRDLLREADTAMYVAKTNGKHSFVVYEPAMQDQLFEQRLLISQLPGGIERGQFRAYYQPIVDLASGQITGAEALVRWQHPERGLLQPGDFLPIAEKAGAIFELDRWMFQEACFHAASWNRLAPGRHFQVSINVSTVSLQGTEIVAAAATAIAVSGVDPRDIVVEVTESALVRDLDATIERLDALKGLGVGIAIDDFGTGYSSLNQLRRFPIDVIKIDKSFVDGVAGGPEEASFAEAIIRLAEQLHLRTVAEGVETEEQAARLVSLGVSTAQGYLFSKPVPAEEMGRFISLAVRGADWRAQNLPAAITENQPVLAQG